MPAASDSPDDDALRGFLLGTLPADRVEQVRAWLDTDTAHVARIDRLSARDQFMDAVTDTATEDPIPALAFERIIRNLADSLPTHSATTVDAPALTSDGETVTEDRVPTADHVPTWAPARLGDYRIVRELGHGGMGYVFEAEDEKLGRRVAVKVLTPELARRPNAAARFLREARAAAAIEHENVVSVLHVGEEVGTPYIVMPLLKGESLADRLKRGDKLHVAEVIRIGRDVASGLAAAHAKGLVHRDLKPGNIWLDADTGRARVLDFGLARQSDGADALTDSGALLGTPAYMSPEQLDGKPATVRSDLFGLGAVLYQCATGQRPFDGPTTTAILKAVSEHNPPPPIEVNPDVPPALSALIIRLLAKNPADRPTCSTDVISALIGNGPTESIILKSKLISRSADVAPRRFHVSCSVVVTFCLLIGAVVAAVATRSHLTKGTAPNKTTEHVNYKGKVDVVVERIVDGKPRLMRLNEPGALPLRQTDKFRIEGEVDPPAYLYVVWVDPDHDVTPVYPWDAAKGWGSRPANEQLVRKVSLPPNVGERYTAPAAKPGVATMVLFARSTPLDVTDDEVKKWFEALPDLPLPPGGDGAAAWFDDYIEVRDPTRLRTFGVVGSDDAFARWQGQLQKSLGVNAQFQTAASFARTGEK